MTRINSGCNSGCSRVDGSGTTNIGGSVTDHAGIMSVDMAIQMLADVLQGQPRNIVTVRMIVAITSGLEIMINSKVAKLDPCTFHVIAGQQA